MRARVSRGLVVVAVAMLAPDATIAASSIGDAISAYRQNRIAEARTGFTRVLGDKDASPRDRATAARELARIAWLIDADAAAAQARLESADAWGDQSCQAGALLVRVLREAGRPDAALDAAARRGRDCSQDRDRLLVQEARAAADLVTTRAGSDREAALARMSTALDALAPDTRNGADAGRLRLEDGLLAGDARTAEAGWKAYFWLTRDDLPPALREDFASAAAVFDRGLAASAQPADRVELIRLLVRAGFAREARQFARIRDVDSRARTLPSWRAIAAYFDFRDAVERVTLAHNRRLAHGKGDGDAYQKNIERLMTAAANAAAPQSGNTGGDARAVRDALRRTWGLHGTIGLTGGYMSLHLGHVIEDTEDRVTQHGRSGVVRRIVIDNTLANGYESWLWDGSGQAGGWAEEGTRLIQVRASYVGSITTALGLRPGQPARVRADAERADTARRDADALAKKSPTDLPGLSQRLRLQALDRLLADIKSGSSAEQPADEATTFQERYWRAILHASITIHEGRHALDQTQFSGPHVLSSDELEYRAKLSELQFAEYPRLALATMVAGQIGGETSHGKANTRILIGLGSWMEAKRTAVTDLDSGQPALTQIDKLTDAQLRTFACAADPACAK